MYLIDRAFSMIENLATDPPPLGPGFTYKQCQEADKLEIWGTNHDDPGPDFTLFQLFDRNGKVIAEKRIDGY
jgi:hypothetical protein